MNWQEIEAALTETDALYQVEYEGKRLMTNGVIAVAVAPGFPLWGKGTALDKLREAWGKWEHTPISAAEIGAEYFGGGMAPIQRKVGALHVQDDFLRCFDRDATWTLTERAAQFAVHENGEFVALVMAITSEDPKPLDASALANDLKRAEDELLEAETAAAECRAYLAKLQRFMQAVA
jgi:hypothetical protein